VNRQLLNAVDKVDHVLCKLGVVKSASFDRLQGKGKRALYAGRLSRYLPQYKTHIGLTPYFPSSKNIDFDVTKPIPLPDNHIDLYQAEDVFEHIEYGALPAVIDEIYRVLKPGGLFRLSVPDYRFDVYRDRSVRDEAGNIVFDPLGGGRFEGGRVVDGGHLWFPLFENVTSLFERTAFAGRGGTVKFLQYNAPDGSMVMEPIDSAYGSVQRSASSDRRVASNARPVSIVVDAVKQANG